MTRAVELALVLAASRVEIVRTRTNATMRVAVDLNEAGRALALAVVREALGDVRRGDALQVRVRVEGRELPVVCLDVRAVARRRETTGPLVVTWEEVSR